VDHPVSSSELVRPWRTATLVATAVAGLELVLLVVAGVVLLGKSLAPDVHAARDQAVTAKAAVVHRAPAAKPKAVHRVVHTLSRAQTGVLVLNGNGVHGAAAGSAALIKARGYTVREVGNAPHTGYPRTMVMYRPGLRAEATRFARDLGIAVVAPLDGMRPAQLHGAKLVEILGNAR
jgi:hypothetical protein